jgi:hypothetical protein
LIRWAESIGPQCGRAVTSILKDKPHPEQGYRACLGLMRLGRTYTPARLEAACQRALALEACSYRHIKATLVAKLEQQPLPDSTADRPPAPPHANVRGQAYYQPPDPLLLDHGAALP